ncbi:hypothetical protein GCM10009854_29770 [Saccharopolyspora halophila]|uniref:RDD domain-containing protein n=1 Tax=Saccharopolyspora halophila TaxID=405551 RepID=A0ABN3GEY3_9PSEU
MSNPYGGPPSGPQQPYGGPPSGPQPQQPYGPPSGPQPQQPYPGGYPQPAFGPPVFGGGPGALAEWGTRALGYLIDGAIPAALMLVLYLISGVAIAGIASAGGASGEGMPVGVVILLVFVGIAYLGILGFSIWNLCYRRGTTGQTIGQKYMRIKTVSEQTGQPIGFGMAFVRQLAHIVDSIICGLPIGWLSPLWDDKKQTWADKIMSTVVVSAEDGPGAMPHGPMPGAPGMPGQPPQGGFPPPGQPPQGGQPQQGGYPPPPGQPPFGQPPQ